MTNPANGQRSVVEPWVLDIAQDLIGVMKRANHNGTLTFVWAGKTLVCVKGRNGIQITFPDPVRDA